MLSLGEIHAKKKQDSLTRVMMDDNPMYMRMRLMIHHSIKRQKLSFCRLMVSVFLDGVSVNGRPFFMVRKSTRPFVRNALALNYIDLNQSDVET